MKNYLLHTSLGVKDYYGIELDYKEAVEAKIRELFKSHDYQMIETPTFEYIDVFTHGTSGLQKPDLYNLINRQGEVLALRNDMTSAIARVVASSNLQGKVFKKYAYISNTFRYPENYQGKAHEFTQAGVELIGISGINADLEILKLIKEILKANEINDFTIHIGSAEFLNVFIDSLGITSDKKDLLFKTIESKDFVSVKSLLISLHIEQEMIKLLMELLQTGGRLSFLKRIMEKVKTPALDSLKYLEALYELLVLEEMEHHILIDFSIYSYLKYYTGIIFQVFMKDASNAILNGGRYDSLLNMFGVDLPAIGFGIHVNHLVSLLMKNNAFKNLNAKKILSVDNQMTRKKAQEINHALREEGYIVGNSLFDHFDDSYLYALDNHYSLLINYNNLKTAKIYQLKRNEEESLKTDKIINRIKKLMDR